MDLLEAYQCYLVLHINAVTDSKEEYKESGPMKSLERQPSKHGRLESRQMKTRGTKDSQCKEILRQLRWDYRGDGSEVEKSSCQWCPWLAEWEVKRLIEDGGKGLEEALEIEKQFYGSFDKHARWHELGKPMVPSGIRAIAGTHSKPFQTGVCTHAECSKYAPGNKTGKGTLIQLRYAEEDGKLVRKSTGHRLTIAEHIERVKTEH